MDGTLFHQFWLCFVPFFVAVDAIGVLPIFLSMTEGIDRKTTRSIILQSVVTAVFVALAFIVVGRAILNLLGIKVADFMVAGGVLLFVISMSDILRAEKSQRALDLDSLGAVPIGVPLITGPAVLTTSILVVDSYGLLLTAIAVTANIAIAGAAFWFAQYLYRFLGRAGMKIASKIASLLLAAIAVMMIRKGIFSFMGLPTSK